MITEWKEGDVFWHLNPSDEEGGFDVKWPRKGKILKIYGAARNYRPRAYICGFDEATGEIDYDSNACSTVIMDELFVSKQDALREFINIQRQNISSIEDMIKMAEKEL